MMNAFDQLNDEVLRDITKCKKGKLGKRAGQNWTICKDLECRVFYFEPNKDTINKWREKQKFYKKGIDRRVIFVAERPGPTPGLIPNDTIVQRIFCVENDSRPGVARKLECCHEKRKYYGLENCYLTNIVKCSKFKGTDKPSKDEINECSKHLIREIEIIDPEVVVAVGDFQYKTLRTDPFKAFIEDKGRKLHKITHWAFYGSKETLLERWDREFTELIEKISRSPTYIPMEVTMNQDDKLKGINADFIKQGASKIKEEDLRKVFENAEKIKDKFKPSGPLGRFIEDFKLLLAVLSDYWSGKYKEMSWWAISAIAFGLLYVLSPIDIIPDVIPFIGLVDDSVVIGLVLMLIQQELHKYKEWKLQND